MAIVAPVAPSAVTPLPTPPSTSDPVNFDTRADAFLGGLPTNQTQMNALGTNVYDNAVKTFDSATISKASADAAVPAANTATMAANDATSAYTNMQKLYLGAKTTAPTVDNQGNPLVAGAWYTNTTDNFWYWWTGSIWKLGVGDLDTVDFETQVTNKSRVVLTDTTQTISGIKTFSEMQVLNMGARMTAQRRLRVGGDIYSALLNTGNTNWITICSFLDTNVPLYSRFLLTIPSRHYAAEIVFSKTTAGAVNTVAKIRVLGAYQYFAFYPVRFRVVDLGTNGASRLDFCFSGTLASTEGYEIIVLEDYVAADRSVPSNDIFISYPFSASAAFSTGITTNNALTVGTGTAITYVEATINTGQSYAPIVQINGAIGQTSLESNSAATG